ncbi:Uma2 family endonuclease [Streptomyces sp. NPDC048002]|uniref:Uma2 family endonuclease n=1 Tax=unclassified Streptomyces TaxID=2593676 RepID=UPI00340D79CC
MTAMSHESLSHAEILLGGFLALDVPDGFRAELIEGEIIVTSPPDGDHEHCISRIARQVIKKSGTDMDFSGNKGLKLGKAEGFPGDRVIPDGAFAPAQLELYRGADRWMPSAGVAMVLEVTSTWPSPSPSPDREEAKRRAYARGGIPLYLLVDRDAAAVTLFSSPEGDDYRQLLTLPFGKPVPLPAPFAFDLETADFL